MLENYDWQSWLSRQQELMGYSYEYLLQHALYTNALHGSGITWPIVHDAIAEPITTNWQGLDREETYHNNLNVPETKDELERWGWIDRPITYTVNSWGFRSDREFNTVDAASVITIGCSFTFGTGLPTNSIWPTLISKQLDLELINLGVPGHGLELSTQWLLSQGHTIEDPRAIVILLPPAGRISWVENANGNIVGNTFMMTHLQYPKIIENIDINAHMHYVRNVNTISLWAQNRNIPVHVFSGFAGHPSEFGLARDLSHNGEPWHQLGAEQIITRIKNH